MKLTWDELGKKLYQTGDKMGVLYLQSSEGTYPEGVAWSGLTGVTITPEGAEPTDLWADDIKYITMRSAEKVSATIEAFMYPDEFMQCDGYDEPVKGLSIGQQSRKAFGFVFVSTLGNDTELNDHGYIIHILYNCTASPSERGYATINDSPEAITFSWSIATTPVNVTGYKPTSLLEIDSTKVDPDRLKDLEDVLFGSQSTDARLPLPDEVISILSEPTPIYSVTLNKTETTIAMGSSETLTATTVPADAEVTWSSSDNAVATVSGGIITPASAGTTNITASITEDGQTYTATCAVTITAQEQQPGGEG